MKKKKTVKLRLGRDEPSVVEAAAPVELPALLDDKALDDVTLKPLRVAYRELRQWFEAHRCEDVIGIRTKEMLLRVRRSGKKTGGHVETGFTAGDDRVLHPDKRERQIVKIAKQQRAEGSSLREIATYLEEKGFVARNNKKFVAVQIKRFVDHTGTFEIASKD